MYAKHSLELLKSKIDLLEVVSPYLKVQRSGATYKALCPFHEERTPSFMIQKGDSHYHCFGCGAHGDAIQFLMTHLRLNFIDAVEHLADRFHVALEKTQERDTEKGPSKAILKEALEKAAFFYHFYLLHTIEGHAALDYLYHRGITLNFIRQFQLGLAPKTPRLFFKAMQEQKVQPQILEAAGLFSQGREFFSDRITIPIRDAIGSVIGFSARKYKTDTYGGKYINTPETILFKKSKVLFGLSYSRKTIAKERKALIVEGQIDALRLIESGFPWVVAGQGTAFGEDMAQELIHLGAKHIYLALDGDAAGQEAAVKIGHLFQKEGVDVLVVPLPEKCDPDLVLQEKGPHVWQKLLDQSIDYVSFLVNHFAKTIDMKNPAGKNELVTAISKRIREWDHPLMVHESLKKLAKLTHTPELLVSADEKIAPQVYIKRSDKAGVTEIDPDRILEADLLRWIFLMGEMNPKLIAIAKANITQTHFRTAAARILFEKYLLAVQENQPRDLLSLAIDLQDPEHQLFLSDVLQKKINRERAESCMIETVQRVLDREWMREREEIKSKMYSGAKTEEEVLELARKFDQLKKMRPEVRVP